MGPMSCSDHDSVLTKADRASLQHSALTSIRRGISGERLQVTPGDYSPALQTHRATFVTLQFEGRLRGCIGSLEAHQALITDVVDNAYAAAFSDPRFPPVTSVEYDSLTLHLSILNPPEAVSFQTEDELIGQLRPGVDGLILHEGVHRGTFLPSVWESLTEPRDFLNQLKCKAGLPGDYWSSTIRIERYTVETIP